MRRQGTPRRAAVSSRARRSVPGQALRPLRSGSQADRATHRALGDEISRSQRRRRIWRRWVIARSSHRTAIAITRRLRPAAAGPLLAQVDGGHRRNGPQVRAVEAAGSHQERRPRRLDKLAAGPSGYADGGRRASADRLVDGLRARRDDHHRWPRADQLRADVPPTGLALADILPGNGSLREIAEKNSSIQAWSYAMRSLSCVPVRMMFAIGGTGQVPRFDARCHSTSSLPA